MNNKGFAVSGIIYSLLVFFLLMLTSIILIMNNTNSIVANTNEEIANILATEGRVWDFNYTGQYQTFTVPETGTYQIELWGAEGGASWTNFAAIVDAYGAKQLGGRGAYTKGEIYLTKDEVIYFYVGGKGADAANGSSNATGGWNGGGNGGLDSVNADTGGGAGGGATDVRLVIGGSLTDWSNITSLRSRIMVAGGGGGASVVNPSSDYNGTGRTGHGVMGAGISNVGMTTYTYSGNSINTTLGADQISGNAFGAGAAGGNGDEASGAGGGGYYGGKASTVNNGSSGAGGTSFISGYFGCNAVTSSASSTPTGQPNHYSGKIFTNMKMLDGNSLMPNNDNSYMLGNKGNGKAKIVLIKDSVKPVNSFPKNMSINMPIANGYYTFTVPNTGYYQIELWGASGGLYSLVHLDTVGKGAYTKGKILLRKDEKLYFYVGGSVPSIAYNGGGGGETSGGGATDVRLVSGTWNDINSLRSRIMVAGGGGAGVYNGCGAYVGTPPGHAGGINGFSANFNSCSAGYGYSGYGGTQTAGGAGGAAGYITGVAGGFGYGGGTTASSGGGGGYYGGGSGTHPGTTWTGGGGGSSFISGYAGSNAINQAGTHTNQPNHYSGYVFSDSKMIAGNAAMVNPDGLAEIGHSGDGYARITFIGYDEEITSNSYVQTGLIMHLDGYTAPKNNIWEDISNTGNDAIMTNMNGIDPNSGYDLVNKAYTVDGTNDYLTVKHNSTQLPTDITISMLVNVDEWVGGTADTFISKRNATSSYFMFAFIADANLTFDFGTPNTRWDTDYIFPTDQWIEVTMTKSGTGRYLYLNGDLIYQSAAPGNAPTGNSDLYIGADGYNGTYYLDAKIRRVSIYNRALSLSEIQNNYMIDQLRFGL